MYLYVYFIYCTLVYIIYTTFQFFLPFCFPWLFSEIGGHSCFMRFPLLAVSADILIKSPTHLCRSCLLIAVDGQRLYSIISFPCRAGIVFFFGRRRYWCWLIDITIADYCNSAHHHRRETYMADITRVKKWRGISAVVGEDDGFVTAPMSCKGPCSLKRHNDKTIRQNEIISNYCQCDLPSLPPPEN